MIFLYDFWKEINKEYTFIYYENIKVYTYFKMKLRKINNYINIFGGGTAEAKNDFFGTNYRKIIILTFLISCFVIIGTIQKNSKEGLYISLKNELNISNSKKERYTAIIVEPRKHRALHFVLRNFFENLDDNWDFVILHGTENKDYLNNIMEKLSKYKSRATLINLNKKNLTYQEYNGLFYDKSFYDYIPTETFLVFQTDSMILKENKDKINDFLEYDYVGAPIGSLSHYGDFKDKEMINEKHYEVGNGGLSLRKKSKMIELLKYIKFAKSKHIFDINKFGEYIPEDRFFSGEMTSEYIDIYKPHVQEASNFAVQELYNDSPFGIHKIWEGLNENEIHKLIHKYPEIRNLIKLNKNSLFVIK